MIEPDLQLNVRRRVRGVTVPGWMWMVLCALLFATVGFLLKMLVSEYQVNVFWVGLVRFSLGTVVMGLPGLAGVWSLRIHNRLLWIARGILGASGVFLGYVAIIYVGLGRGMMLTYLMGVFGAVSGIFILKERPSATIFAAVVGATLGGLLSCEAQFPQGAEWFALAAAMLSGITLSLVRRLRRHHGNPVVLLSQNVFGVLILVGPAVMYAPPHTIAAWTLLLLLCIADIAGQLCMTQGLAMCPVARGGTLMMLAPIFGLLAGTMLLGERLTLTQWIGSAMVLVASTITVIVRSDATKNNQGQMAA